jgi:hypothetical protein
MIGCPDPRVGVLPTSVLPLPTTAILVLEVRVNARLHRKVACVWLSRSLQRPGSNFPWRTACLERKKNTAGEAGRSAWLRAANHSRNKASCTRRHRGLKKHLIEIIEFFGQIVSSACFHETILLTEETIFRFRADIRKQRLAISYPRSEHNAST